MNFPYFNFVRKLCQSIFVTIITLACAWDQADASSGTATNLYGLDYTGTTTTGALVAGGGNDQNWNVTYADVGGVSYTGTGTNSTQYTGAAYVVNGSNVTSADYVQNTGYSQWITAPGASSAQTGGTTNTGGNFLPGNGTSGPNTATYEYTLAFQITGTLGNGGSKFTVGNDVQISLTIAADDQYQIYVNPTLNGNGSVNTSTSTLGASGLASWTNSTVAYLQNYSASSTETTNSGFIIGTNYLTVVVENTNATTGSSSSNALNASGLLVYEVGSEAVIGGHPVPEVGAWLPMVGALGLYGVALQRRKRQKQFV